MHSGEMPHPAGGHIWWHLLPGEGDGSVAPTLNPRPRNFATGKFKQGSSVTRIFDTLGKGVPGTAMVKFTNLSEEERWALAWYVLELKAGRAHR